MDNPLDAFKGLSTGQKAAVAVGGVAVVGGLYLYQKKKSAASAATAVTPAAAAPSTAGTTVTDPSTGQVYPAGAVDPATGLTYATEIQEYGSVATAEQDVSSAGFSAGTGGGYGAGYGGGSGYSETGTSTGTTATNAQWVSEVESALSQLGYSNADIQSGLAKYFSSSPQTPPADGTNLYQMMDTAIGEFGPPPSGTYALVRATTGAPGPGSASVTVPDVTGRTDLATAEQEIEAAGLVPHAAGDNAAGNKGKVTAQDPAAGSQVSKGSAVTLTYTVNAAAAGAVKVPDVIGQDAVAAQRTMSGAGLKSKLSGPPFRAGQGTRIIEFQNPQAGADAAKGSTVTLGYKLVAGPKKG